MASFRNFKICLRFIAFVLPTLHLAMAKEKNRNAKHVERRSLARNNNISSSQELRQILSRRKIKKAAKEENIAEKATKMQKKGETESSQPPSPVSTINKLTPPKDNAENTRSPTIGSHPTISPTSVQSSIIGAEIVKTFMNGGKESTDFETNKPSIMKFGKNKEKVARPPTKAPIMSATAPQTPSPSIKNQQSAITISPTKSTTDSPTARPSVKTAQPSTSPTSSPISQPSIPSLSFSDQSMDFPSISAAPTLKSTDFRSITVNFSVIPLSWKRQQGQAIISEKTDMRSAILISTIKSLCNHTDIAIIQELSSINLCIDGSDYVQHNWHFAKSASTGTGAQQDEMDTSKTIISVDTKTAITKATPIKSKINPDIMWLQLGVQYTVLNLGDEDFQRSYSHSHEHETLTTAKTFNNKNPIDILEKQTQSIIHKVISDGTLLTSLKEMGAEIMAVSVRGNEDETFGQTMEFGSSSHDKNLKISAASAVNENTASNTETAGIIILILVSFVVFILFVAVTRRKRKEQNDDDDNTDSETRWHFSESDDASNMLSISSLGDSSAGSTLRGESFVDDFHRYEQNVATGVYI